MAGVAFQGMVAGLAVRADGPKGGPAVLFSAGLGGSGGYWAREASWLAADGFRVVGYDHRGTGRSERSPLPSPYGVSHLAGDMLAVLDGLGIDRAHVVGHAAGGVAGLALAARVPGRVRSLCVVNGWARAGTHFRRCMAIRRRILDASGVDAYLEAQPLFLFPAGWIEENADRLDRERAAHAASFQDRDALLARMAALEGFDAERDGVASAEVPALLVSAADDMLVPAAATEELAALMPHARVDRFARGGHAVNVTEPERFDALLRGFLVSND